MGLQPKDKLVRLLVLLTFVAICAAPLWGQGGTGELTGLVTDPSGAVVSGVQVTLTNFSTGDKRTTVTTQAGIYRFNALPIVGTYNLQISAAGFRPVAVHNNHGLSRYNRHPRYHPGSWHDHRAGYSRGRC